jgi:hypothetical protein
MFQFNVTGSIALVLRWGNISQLLEQVVEAAHLWQPGGRESRKKGPGPRYVLQRYVSLPSPVIYCLHLGLPSPNIPFSYEFINGLILLVKLVSSWSNHLSIPLTNWGRRPSKHEPFGELLYAKTITYDYLKFLLLLSHIRISRTTYLGTKGQRKWWAGRNRHDMWYCSYVPHCSWTTDIASIPK